MKSIKIILASCLTLVIMSCNQTESLDKYYVTHQEKQGFLALDIPTNILELDESNLSAKQQKAYESISKLNFLGFKQSESDAATFESEKKQVAVILSNSKYQELIKFKDEGKEGVIKYIGQANAIDELILFGSEKNNGFAVVRILGDDMNPQNIFEMLRAIKGSDIKTEQLKKIGNFFDLDQIELKEEATK